MWFRHDSAFADDPRTLALVKAQGAAGWLALASVWAWCSRQQTDELTPEAAAAAMGPWVALGAIPLEAIEGLVDALVEHDFLDALEGGRLGLVDRLVVWPEGSAPVPSPVPPVPGDVSPAVPSADPIEARREKARLKKQKQRGKFPMGGTFLTPPVPSVSPPVSPACPPVVPPVPGDMSPAVPPCPGDMSPPVPSCPGDMSPAVPGDSAVSPSQTLPLSETQTQEPKPEQNQDLAREGGTFLTSQPGTFLTPDGASTGTFLTPPTGQDGTFLTHEAAPSPPAAPVAPVAGQPPATPAKPARSKASGKASGKASAAGRGVGEAVDAVLAHWAATLFPPHRQPKVTAPRRRRVEARLSEGFVVADLCKAIDGAAKDDFLMGRHPKSAERGGYRDVETVLRDAAQVERLMALAEGPGPAGAVDPRPLSEIPDFTPLEGPPPAPPLDLTPEQIAANKARVAEIRARMLAPPPAPPVYVPLTPEQHAERVRKNLARLREVAPDFTDSDPTPTPEA